MYDAVSCSSIQITTIPESCSPACALVVYVSVLQVYSLAYHIYHIMSIHPLACARPHASYKAYVNSAMLELTNAAFTRPYRIQSYSHVTSKTQDAIKVGVRYRRRPSNVLEVPVSTLNIDTRQDNKGHLGNVSLDLASRSSVLLLKA